MVFFDIKTKITENRVPNRLVSVTQDYNKKVPKSQHPAPPVQCFLAKKCITMHNSKPTPPISALKETCFKSVPDIKCEKEKKTDLNTPLHRFLSAFVDVIWTSLSFPLLLSLAS